MSHEVAFDELADFADGRLSPADAQRIEAHLAGCPDCRQDLAWLRRTVAALEARDLVEAPAAVVQRAQALYRPPAPRFRLTFQWAELWRTLTASRALRVACSVGLALLLILAGVWSYNGSTIVQAATLAEVQGTVEVRSGAGDWQPGMAGMLLAAGSVVRSGGDGWAVLSYADGSHSYLTENVEVEIVSLTGRRDRRASQVRLAQLSGYTEHDLASAHSSIEVQTEAGVLAQAQAAAYGVWVEESGEVEVVAERGQVTVQAPGTTANLSEGEHGVVSGGEVVVTAPTPTATPEPGAQPQPSATPRHGRPQTRPSTRATATQAVTPTATPETRDPAAPEASVTPKVNGRHTPEPTHTPRADKPEPSHTPKHQDHATATTVHSIAPSVVPSVTLAPTNTLKPTVTPSRTATPGNSAKHTATPVKATNTSTRPATQNLATVTPGPSATTKPTALPTARPTDTPRPYTWPNPTRSPYP